MVSELLALLNGYRTQGPDSPAGRSYLAYVSRLQSSGVNVDQLIARLTGDQRADGLGGRRDRVSAAEVKREGAGASSGLPSGSGAASFLASSQNLPSLSLPPDFEARLSRRVRSPGGLHAQGLAADGEIALLVKNEPTEEADSIVDRDRDFSKVPEPTEAVDAPKPHLAFSDPYIVPRQGLIRRIILLLDSSYASRFPSPETNSAYAGALYRFVQGLFAESPLCELALITLQDGKAYVENGFSNSIFIFREVIQNKFVPSGTMSLQAGLSISHELFRQLNPQVTKEVIFINFSNSTVDAGNLEETVEKLRLDDAIFHAVCMGACISVLKNITKNCRDGNFEILDSGDMEGLEQFLGKICKPPSFLDHRVPSEHRDRYVANVPEAEGDPDANSEADIGTSGSRKSRQASTQLRVGFPTRYTYTEPVPCFCHGRNAEVLYKCPGCGAYLCGTSTCPVCKLYLIIYPTLARSSLNFRETWKARRVPLFSVLQAPRAAEGAGEAEDAGDVGDAVGADTSVDASADASAEPALQYAATLPFAPADPADLSCCLCAVPLTMRQLPFPTGGGKPSREDARTAFYGLCEKCGSVYCSHCAGFCETELQQCVICGGSDDWPSLPR